MYTIARPLRWRAVAIVDSWRNGLPFTVLTRSHVAQLTDRYSERKEDAAKLEARTKISAI